jgi:hypothetical protein
MFDPKALDTAFGRLTATLVAARAKGGVLAIDGKSLATVARVRQACSVGRHHHSR